MNYKLNLGKTDFKLNEIHLDKKKYIDLWQDTISSESSSDSYHLLNGPAYSNGLLHHGHF
jgi:isoleucyl-tRNA synthetase